MEAAPSRTAMFAAVSRGLFRMEATPPWVLDDALALVLVGPVWQELHEQLNPAVPRPGRSRVSRVCLRPQPVCRGPAGCWRLHAVRHPGRGA
jgi:hypothetical protein